MAEKNDFLMYKGRPLVRKDNVIYYGDMGDKYVIMMQILSTRTVGGEEIADKVSVQLMLTDPEIRAKDKIVKKSEKNGLYNAMDIADVWLERALKDN